MSSTLLSIKNLTVDYLRDGQPHTAVHNVSFDLKKGECLALVGESGCGKSTLALTLMGLLPKKESRIMSGQIELDGQPLLANNDEEWRAIRGKRIGMIFQDPFSSLNPVLTIGRQIQETLDLGSPKWNMKELMRQVQLNDSDRIAASYPHQLSGGQRQRVMIAIALARGPEILIADEPTTALDVTVQDEIIKLLKSLQNETHMAMLFVTHNFGLLKNVADRVAVMRRGEILETGDVSAVLAQPKNDYTNGLLRCIPSLKKKAGPLPTLEEWA